MVCTVEGGVIAHCMMKPGRRHECYSHTSQLTERECRRVRQASIIWLRGSARNECQLCFGSACLLGVTTGSPEHGPLLLIWTSSALIMPRLAYSKHRAHCRSGAEAQRLTDWLPKQQAPREGRDCGLVGIGSTGPVLIPEASIGLIKQDSTNSSGGGIVNLA